MNEGFVNFLWGQISEPVFVAMAVVGVVATMLILVAQFRELRKGLP